METAKVKKKKELNLETPDLHDLIKPSNNPLIKL